MEKSQRLVDLANRRFSDIILDGFKLFFRNYGTLILPLASFQVLLIVLDIFILTDLKWYIDSFGLNISDIMDKFADNVSLTESEWNLITSFLLLNIALLFLENLIGAIIITIAMCSVSNYILKRHLHIETRFIEAFKSSFKKKMFLVILIIGICIPLGSLLLFIPAIIIFGFYIFLVFTYNMEDIENPIKEARNVSRGNFWKVISIFIINFIFIFICSFIFNSIIDVFLDPDTLSSNYDLWQAPSTRNYGMIIIYQILVNLVDILLAPLFICFLTSLFTSLKAKKDLGFSYQKQYLPVRERYERTVSQPIGLNQSQDQSVDEISPTKLQLEGEFYCPFCGYKINTPKKFCPNCGESFSFINK
ncbi:MAG: zinc ribbon domain-containing protein [Candidatus Hodarchaeota archaeon]